MKKHILLLPCFGFFAVFGQTVTNAPESKYELKKVYHLDATPVQSQGNTGTCWSFSALSFFESELIRQGNKNPDILSEMYIVRKAYEAKADRFIRMDGKTNFGEGGAFHDIPYVIRRYGIVPQEVYTGLKGTKKEYNHEEMFDALNGYVKTILDQVNNGRGISTDWKKVFASMLDNYLGPDPVQFTYKGKQYTPKSYAASLGLNMDNYVSITSFTNDPFWESCEITIPDNWAWGDSYNVPLEDMVAIAEHALKTGYTLAWGADVSEKGFNFRQGIALVPENASAIQTKGSDNKSFNNAGAEKKANVFLEPGTEQTITQELRQEGYDQKLTTDDHGMHIVGMYTDQNGTRYFLIKNSWGTENMPEGYMYVSEHYFRLKTINIYLHKDGLAKDVKSKLRI